jgi:hypothetical protein
LGQAFWYLLFLVQKWIGIGKGCLGKSRVAIC